MKNRMMNWLVLCGLGATSVQAMPRPLQETLQAVAGAPDSEMFMAGAITLFILGLVRRRMA